MEEIEGWGDWSQIAAKLGQIRLEGQIKIKYHRILKQGRGKEFGFYSKHVGSYSKFFTERADHLLYSFPPPHLYYTKLFTCSLPLLLEWKSMSTGV